MFQQIWLPSLLAASRRTRQIVFNQRRISSTRSELVLKATEAPPNHRPRDGTRTIGPQDGIGRIIGRRLNFTAFSSFFDAFYCTRLHEACTSRSPTSRFHLDARIYTQRPIRFVNSNGKQRYLGHNVGDRAWREYCPSADFSSADMILRIRTNSVRKGITVRLVLAATVAGIVQFSPCNPCNHLRIAQPDSPPQCGCEPQGTQLARCQTGI